MSEDAHGGEGPQNTRPSSQTRLAAVPTQNPLGHTAYAQSLKFGAFSQAYASTLPDSSLSRPEFDALPSPRQFLPPAPVRNAFELLSLEGQHYSRAEVTGGGRRMNQSSFTGLLPITVDSQFSSQPQPNARHHQSQAAPLLTLPPGVDQHPTAFTAPPLPIPLRLGLPFPSGAHSGLLPAAIPYHHSAQVTMGSQPGFKTRDDQSPQYSRPLFTQVLTSEPSPKPLHRATTETGFVMWVGNLESSASLDALYTFFRQIDPIPLPLAQSAVVSIMYMPSTNCALVNMRNEATLREAVERFHGSRLRPNTKSARLVCRRRGSELGPESSAVKSPGSGLPSSPRPTSTPSIEIPEGSRFFVLKSIDHASVNHCVQANMWSTQFHNEPILNEALRRSPVVYLVFGVNKTGQFFGYAKMVAPIQKRSANQEVPRLDGTTVHMGGDVANNESISCPIANLIERVRPTQGEKDGWGTPFPIRWICTEPLGFTRIRYIRNAWNNDREVKVSRDGQELSPDCGRMLLEEWARQRPPRTTTERSEYTRT